MDRLAELGIDLWSMLVYAANTGVVLVALVYFAYKPLLKIIDSRRKEITDSIETANRLRLEFSQKLEESIAEKQRVEEKLSKELEDLRRLVETKRAEMLREIEVARAEILRRADEEIAHKRSQLLKAAEKDITSLMSRIILEIVQNKVPEKVIAESVSEAWKSYAR